MAEYEKEEEQEEVSIYIIKKGGIVGLYTFVFPPWPDWGLGLGLLVQLTALPVRLFFEENVGETFLYLIGWQI